MVMSMGQVRSILAPMVHGIIPHAQVRVDVPSECFFLVDLEGKEHLLLTRSEIEDGALESLLAESRVRELVGLSAKAEPDYMGATRAICGH